MVVDVAVSGDRNVNKIEAENILINKDLLIGIQFMWTVKAKVVPVIRGTTGSFSESLRHFLSNIPGKHKIK